MIFVEAMSTVDWESEVVLDWLISEAAALPLFLGLVKVLPSLLPLPDVEKYSAQPKGGEVVPCESEPEVFVIQEKIGDQERHLQVFLCSSQSAPEESATQTGPGKTTGATSDCLRSLLTDLRTKLVRCNDKKLLPFNAAPLIARIATVIAVV